MVGLSSNVSEIVCGRNAVMEALKSGRSLNKILVAKGERQGSIKEVLAVAKEHKIIIQEVEMKKLEELAKGIRHQGVLAYAAPVDYVELEDIIGRAQELGEHPFIVLLDELDVKPTIIAHIEHFSIFIAFPLSSLLL